MNYPLSIQSFEKIRQGNFIYIDKIAKEFYSTVESLVLFSALRQQQKSPPCRT